MFTFYFEMFKQVVAGRDGIHSSHDHAECGLEELVLADVGHT